MSGEPSSANERVSRIQRFTKRYAAGNASEEEKKESISSISSLILSGQATVEDTVKALGDLLISPSGAKRSKGTELLGRVTSSLPVIPAATLPYLLSFFRNRCADEPSVGAALLGLAACTSAKTPINGEELLDVFKALIFLDTQSLTWKERGHVYETLHNILRRNTIVPMFSDGDSPLLGVSQTIFGEKDPRNLLTAFKLARATAERFGKAEDPDIKELYDAILAYYPIKFHDPKGITKEELSNALMEAMTCTEGFAEESLGYMMEELEEADRAAKADIMEDIRTIVKKSHKALPFQMRDDLLGYCIAGVFDQINPQQFEDSALKLITTLWSVATNKEEQQKSVLRLESDVLQHLGRPETKKAMRAAAILSAAAKGSSAAAGFAVERVLPALKEEVMMPESGAIKEATLSLLNIILAGILEGENIESSLLSTINEILDLIVLSTAMGKEDTTSDGCRTAAFSALLPVLKKQVGKRLMTAEQVGTAFKSARDVVTSINTSTALRESAIEFMRVAVQAGRLTVEEVRNFVDGEIQPFTLGVLEGGTDSDDFEHRAESLLNPLAHLVEVVGLSRTVIGVFFSVLSYVSKTKHDKARSAIVMILELVRAAVPLADFDSSTFEWMNESLDSCLSTLLDRGHNDEAFLRPALSAVIRVFKSLKGKDGYDSKSLEQSLRSHLLKLLESREDMDRSMPLTVVYGAVLGSMPREAVSEVSSDLFSLLRLQHDRLPVWVMDGLANTIAVLVNKSANAQESTTALQECLPSSCGGNASMSVSSVRIAWSAIKGAGLRGLPLATKSAVALLEQCAVSPDLAEATALGVESLMTAESTYLYPEGHAIVSPLFRQKFFTFLLDPLLQTLPKAQPSVQTHYLAILGTLLSSVPVEIVMDNISRVLPPILESLKEKSSELRCSTLDLISGLWEAESMRDVFGQYASELVKDVLEALSDMSSKKLRTKAANCLAVMSTLPHVKIYPHVGDVVEALGRAVGDHKRVVRKASVRARAFWLAVKGT